MAITFASNTRAKTPAKYHNDLYGYEEYFYTMKQTYFDYNGNTYWHMGNIINRCPDRETYPIRKKEGRLPEDN